MPGDYEGDPEGRRVHRERARQLGEAARLAEAVRIVLRRAKYGDLPAVQRLISAIRVDENDALTKAEGAIRSRKKFKHKTGHPLHAGKPSNLLFLDESGRADHKGQRHFALAAVSMSETAATSYQQRADRVKTAFFGTTDITFHEPMMRRHDGPYYFSGDTVKQREFLAAIDELVRDTECTVFGTGIRKDAYENEFVSTGIDPYLPANVYTVAIQMVLERYVHYLMSHPHDPMGRVTFEPSAQSIWNRGRSCTRRPLGGR